MSNNDNTNNSSTIQGALLGESNNTNVVNKQTSTAWNTTTTNNVHVSSLDEIMKEEEAKQLESEVEGMYPEAVNEDIGLTQEDVDKIVATLPKGPTMKTEAVVNHDKLISKQKEETSSGLSLHKIIYNRYRNNYSERVMVVDYKMPNIKAYNQAFLRDYSYEGEDEGWQPSDMSNLHITWLMLRPDLRTSLPSTYEQWYQTKHPTFHEKPSYVTKEMFVSVMKFYQQVFTPRIGPDKTPVFMKLLQTTDPYKISESEIVHDPKGNECVIIYRIAAKLAARRGFETLENLWRAASLYLGVLLYPFAFMYYEVPYCEGLLDLSEDFLINLERLGSDMLLNMFGSQLKISPHYDMMPSYWGARFMHMYGFRGPNGHLIPVDMGAKESIAPSPVPIEIVMTDKRMRRFYPRVTNDENKIQSLWRRNVTKGTKLTEEEFKLLYRKKDKIQPQRTKKETNERVARHRRKYSSEDIGIEPGPGGFKQPADCEPQPYLLEPVPNHIVLGSPRIPLEYEEELLTPREREDVEDIDPAIKLMANPNPPKQLEIHSTPIRYLEGEDDIHPVGDNRRKPTPEELRKVKPLKKKVNYDIEDLIPQSVKQKQFRKKKGYAFEEERKEPPPIHVEMTENDVLQMYQQIADDLRAEGVPVAFDMGVFPTLPTVQQFNQLQQLNDYSAPGVRLEPLSHQQWREGEYDHNGNFYANGRWYNRDELEQIRFYDPADMAEVQRSISEHSTNDNNNNNHRVGYAMENPVRVDLRKYRLKRVRRDVIGEESARGSDSQGTYNDPLVDTKYSKLLKEYRTIPDPPFPTIHLLEWGKGSSDIEIDEQIRATTKCDWSKIVPKWKDVMTDELQQIWEKSGSRRFLTPPPYKLRTATYKVFTLEPILAEHLMEVFHNQEIADRTLMTKLNQSISGRCLLQDATVTSVENQSGEYEVNVVLKYFGPRIIGDDGQIEARMAPAHFKPPNITTHVFDINIPFFRLVASSPANFVKEYVDIYNGIGPNSLYDLLEQRNHYIEETLKYANCAGTISGQIVRFTMCMATRQLTVSAAEDHKWINPTVILGFRPQFDLRTLTPEKAAWLYLSYPAVKVNLNASTGYFTDNASRNYLSKVNDAMLMIQFLHSLDIPEIAQSALETEMKNKKEIIKRDALYTKTRNIFVTNSYTQIPLNVLFTRAESQFMRRAMEDPTFPCLLGVDPPSWVRNLIQAIRNKVFTRHYYWYSYSDNVYCLDAETNLLYSFDGEKMESSIRAEDIRGLMRTLTQYSFNSKFKVYGKQDMIESCIRKAPEFSFINLTPYQIDIKGLNRTYCHTPMALNGSEYRFDSLIDRISVNKVIFYPKEQNVIPYTYNVEEGCMEFDCLGLNGGTSNDWWESYLSLQADLCEHSKCVLGGRVFNAHFLPSGVQYTSLANTYKTLGTVIYCNNKQLDPKEFLEVPKTWRVTLENIADLNPIVDGVHEPKFIRLDFLGLDAICSLGYWSLVLREGNLMSSPLYRNTTVKNRLQESKMIEFAVYLSTLVNGAFNYPYYAMLIYSRLNTLAPHVPFSAEDLEVILGDSGTPVNCDLTFGSSQEFWMKFMELVVKRLALEDNEDVFKLLPQRVTELIAEPFEKSASFEHLKDLIAVKYPTLGTTTLNDDLDNIIPGEQLLTVLTNAQIPTETVDNLKVIAYLLANAYRIQEFTVFVAMMDKIAELMGAKNPQLEVVRNQLTTIAAI